MNLLNANTLKSLKANGFIALTYDSGSVIIGTTDLLGSALSSKADTSAIPSLTGYLNAVSNDAGDTSNPKLIALGTSGSNLTIDYSQLRTAVIEKSSPP